MPTKYSVEDDRNLEQVPYDKFENRNFLIISVYVIHLISFVFFVALHHYKAGPETKGFNR